MSERGTMYKVCVLGYDAPLARELCRSVMGVGWRVRLMRRWDEPELELAGGGASALRGGVEQVVVSLDDVGSVVEAMRGCNYVFYDALCGLEVGDASAQRVGVARMRRVCQALREANADKLVVTSSVATMGLGVGRDVIDESGMYAPQWGAVGERAALALVERELWRYGADALNMCVLNPTAPLYASSWPRELGGDDVEVNVCSGAQLARMHVNASLYGAAGRRYIIGGVQVKAGELARKLKPGVVTSRQRLAYGLGRAVDSSRAVEALELVMPNTLDALWR